MSTIDISRFAYGLPAVFAPAVQEQQTLYAFLEQENSLPVLADNVLKIPDSQNNDLSGLLEMIQNMQPQTSTKKETWGYMFLDNGTDENGEVIVVPIPIGPLNPDTMDETKLIAIMDALGDCLLKSAHAYRYVDENGVMHVLGY